MFYDNRQQTRTLFFQVWNKHQQQQPIEPLEQMILQVILAHPEYHKFLSEQHLEQEFSPELGETNPFLHMGLHIGIQEQITTDRPNGMRELYQTALQQGQAAHEVEHLIMECLAEMLWTVQRYQTPPDEAAYLSCIRTQLQKK